MVHKCVIFLRIFITPLMVATLAGCGNSSSTGQQSVQDPIQQEIEAKVKQKGVTEIPPGYMMNSGGELVPVDDAPPSDQ